MTVGCASTGHLVRGDEPANARAVATTEREVARREADAHLRHRENEAAATIAGGIVAAIPGVLLTIRGATLLDSTDPQNERDCDDACLGLPDLSGTRRTLAGLTLAAGIALDLLAAGLIAEGAKNLRRALRARRARRLRPMAGVDPSHNEFRVGAEVRF